MNRSVMRHSAAVRFSSVAESSASSISSIRLGNGVIRRISLQFRRTCAEADPKLETRSEDMLSAARGVRVNAKLISASWWLLTRRLPGLEGLLVLGVGRIEPENRLSGAHALDHEGLE